MTARRVATVVVVALVLAALAGPVLLMVRGTRSSAAFGDTEDLGLNRLGAATLDISIGSGSSAIVVTNMAPGDRSIGEVELRNTGSLPLRYALGSEATGPNLAAWLRWDMWMRDTDCAAEGAATVLSSDLELLLVGAELPAGVKTTITGNPAVGADIGDRRLAPDDSEVICLRATLPAGAPNDVQGLRLVQNLVADAEHDIDPTEVTP